MNYFITNYFIGEIGGGWWNLHYADYFLLLTFGGIPWQVINNKCFESVTFLPVDPNLLDTDPLKTRQNLGVPIDF